MLKKIVLTVCALFVSTAFANDNVNDCTSSTQNQSLSALVGTPYTDPSSCSIACYRAGFTAYSCTPYTFGQLNCDCYCWR